MPLHSKITDYFQLWIYYCRKTYRNYQKSALLNLEKRQYLPHYLSDKGFKGCSSESDIAICNCWFSWVLRKSDLLIYSLKIGENINLFYHLTLDTRQSTLNTQHSTLLTQHSSLNTPHSTLNTRHSTACLSKLHFSLKYYQHKNDEIYFILFYKQ